MRNLCTKFVKNSALACKICDARVLYQKGQIKTKAYEKELFIMDGCCADDGCWHEQLQ